MKATQKDTANIVQPLIELLLMTARAALPRSPGNLLSPSWPGNPDPGTPRAALRFQCLGARSRADYAKPGHVTNEIEPAISAEKSDQCHYLDRFPSGSL
jgi:hypothetical protein